MATKPRKARQQKRTGKKQTRQRKAGSRIDQMFDLQRRVIDRYAQLAAAAANRLVEGDYNPSSWITDYSSMWSDCAEDLNDAAKIILQEPSNTTPNTEARRQSGDVCRSWLSLQQSLLSRLANYYGGVGKLVARGSMEPRDWVEEGADLWRDMLADMADWAHRESGTSLRPTAHWIPRVRLDVKPGRLTANAEFTIPLDAFDEAFLANQGSDGEQQQSDQTDQSSHRKTITPVTDGLSRLGGGMKLEFKQHIDFAPAEVDRSEPYCDLRLFDLPRLTERSVYAGFVWAKETLYPVAAVELHVI